MSSPGGFCLVVTARPRCPSTLGPWLVTLAPQGSPELRHLLLHMASGSWRHFLLGPTDCWAVHLGRSDRDHLWNDVSPGVQIAEGGCLWEGRLLAGARLLCGTLPVMLGPRSQLEGGRQSRNSVLVLGEERPSTHGRSCPAFAPARGVIYSAEGAAVLCTTYRCR